MDRLNNSAIGNFTPFTHSAVGLTDITSQMTPSIGEGLFIPLTDMNTGMAVRVTVWASVATTTVQDFRLYLTSDTAGNDDYTSDNFEAIPITAGTNIKWTWTILVKQLSLPSTTSSVTETSFNTFFLSPGQQQQFSSLSGMPLFFQAEWRTAGTHAITFQEWTVERIANFYA